MNPKLEQILKRQDVWQASRQAPAGLAASTGYARLDSRLHQGGWPASALTELLSQVYGIGEWQLLLPTLAQACVGNEVCLLVAPPFLPYPPALEQAGVRSDSLLVATPGNLPETIWCIEQGLKSQACHTIVAWLGTQVLQTAQLRKLQLAARGSGSLIFLYRHQRFAGQHSPAPLRLLVSHQNSSIALEILKQPGGWAGQQVLLHRDQNWLQARLTTATLPAFTSASIRINNDTIQPITSLTLPALSAHPL